MSVRENPSGVIGIMAAILASLHMQTADDLFGLGVLTGGGLGARFSNLFLGVRRARYHAD